MGDCPIRRHTCAGFEQSSRVAFPFVAAGGSSPPRSSQVRVLWGPIFASGAVLPYFSRSGGLSTWRFCPVATSHTLIVPSFMTAATRDPSGFSATRCNGSP